MKKFHNSFYILFLAILSQAGIASAAPSLSGDVVFELESEQILDSTSGAGNEDGNTFGRVEFTPTLSLNDNFSITAQLVLEPVEDIDPSKSKFFDREGVFIEELKLEYQNQGFQAFAGKFNPNFGTAWDYGRGIWAEDLARNGAGGMSGGYRLSEMIGTGAGYDFDLGGLGTHTIGASTFFQDTTWMSESAITERGNNSKEDGGPANTESFDSFLVSLDGKDIFGVRDLSYHLAYTELKDLSTNDNIRGVVANVNYVFSAIDNLDTDILVEYAHLDTKLGPLNDNDHVNYLTANMVNTYNDSWLQTISHTTYRDNSAKMDDNLTEVSAGYKFDNGLSLEAGWRHADLGGEKQRGYGGLARYKYNF